MAGPRELLDDENDQAVEATPFWRPGKKSPCSRLNLTHHLGEGRGLAVLSQDKQ